MSVVQTERALRQQARDAELTERIYITSGMHTLLRALLLVPLALDLAGAQQEPPRRLDFSNEAAERAQEQDAAATTREMRTKFVRSQTILGLLAYGPTFATMLADDGVTFTAGYLVMAGGSFFAATEITRQITVTPARQFLSSRMAWRGTLDGLVLGDAGDLRGRSAAGLGWIGGVSGTGLGLYLARDLREGEAVSMVVGHDIGYVSTLLLTHVIDPDDLDDQGISSEARAVASTLAGWGGYALGKRYARNAMYEVTAGDAMMLWLGAGIGATTLGTFIAESSPSDQAVAGTVLLGGLAGIWGADRWLVRRFDHSPAEGTLVALGGGAGALMGIGVGVLIAGEAERGAALTLGLASLGAIGGVALTERYAQPAMDGGRSVDVGRVEFNPIGALAAAARVDGRHPILKITF